MDRIQGSMPKLNRYLRETTYLEELKTGEYMWPGRDLSFQPMGFGLTPKKGDSWSKASYDPLFVKKI